MLPRLLNANEIESGQCDYYIDKQCHSPQNSCPAEFVVCLRGISNRRFYLNLNKLYWQDQENFCKSKGAHLAEFPNNFESGVTSFFLMYKALMTDEFITFSQCSDFSSTNIQCLTYFGARYLGGQDKWARNGSLMPTSWNLSLPVVAYFSRRATEGSGICFNVIMERPKFFKKLEIKRQVRHKQLGLCECLLWSTFPDSLVLKLIQYSSSLYLENV